MSRRLAFRVASSIALALPLLPARSALACAFCAQAQGPKSSGMTLLIGMMLVLPFFLVGLVVRQVMKTEEPPLAADSPGLERLAADRFSLSVDRFKGDLR